jgi:heptosyltransferase-1
MHLAAMLGIPVVALFGPTDPNRNGPYYPKHTILRHERSVASYSHKRDADAGLMSITFAEVTAAARRLLNSA